MNTQEQLKQILDDPKQYEDEKCQVPTVEMVYVYSYVAYYKTRNW